MPAEAGRPEPGQIAIWEASDGYPIHLRRYEPAGETFAHLVGLHGIQSHSGWYERSSRLLAEAGFAIHFLDRRGSGLNWLNRGDATSFRRLVADVVEFIRELKGQTAEPVFLWAGSWGGKVAAAAAAELGEELAGLALWCPGFCPKVHPSPGQRLRIAAARVRRPRRLFLIPLNDPRLFTADQRWQQFIRDDPLVLTHATARLLVSSVLLDRHLRRVAERVTQPVLVLLGERDRIMDNARTRAFVESWASRQREIIEYSGWEHTLEFEVEPERFVGDVVVWLKGQLANHADALPKQ